VKKPNPKNIQNAEKIKELEEQIQRFVRLGTIDDVNRLYNNVSFEGYKTKDKLSWLFSDRLQSRASALRLLINRKSSYPTKLTPSH
jgi:hypothetical protein